MYCIVKTIYIYNLSSKYRGLDSGVPCTGEQYRIPTVKKAQNNKVYNSLIMLVLE